MNESLGKRIEKIRLDKGMNKTEFGRLFNASGSLVNKWENHNITPSEERLIQIAEKAHITLDELLYGSLDEYARRLLDELEEKLKEDDTITKGAIPLIISDIEVRLFPTIFPREFNDRKALEEEFSYYKDLAIETWTNNEHLDFEIASRIRQQISSTINDNLKYFYADFYKNEDNEVDSGDKISERSDSFIRRLHDLDNFNRAYIDVFRFLNQEEVIQELDKINNSTKKLKELNGTIDLNEL